MRIKRCGCGLQRAAATCRILRPNRLLRRQVNRLDTGYILSEIKRVATPIQTAFEVAQHSVDLLKLGQGLWFASGNGGERMRGSSRAGGGKAGQHVGKHRAGRGQIRCLRRRDRLALEAEDVGELGTQWMICAANQDFSEERGFFLRSSTACAAADLAARVGVIDLNVLLKRMVLFASGHRVHQLMTDELGDGVIRLQLLFEFERRQPDRSLPDEIDRQEPSRQGRLGVLDTMRRSAGSETRAASVIVQALLRIPFLHRTVKELRHVQVRCKLNSICRLGSTFRYELRD